MPIYEFRCDACGRRFADLIRALSDQPAVACPQCGATRVTRLISRFATARSSESMLDDLAERLPDETDPQALSRWAREFSSEIGEDLGEDFQESVDQVIESEFSSPKSEPSST